MCELDYDIPSYSEMSSYTSDYIPKNRPLMENNLTLAIENNPIPVEEETVVKMLITETPKETLQKKMKNLL